MDVLSYELGTFSSHKELGFYRKRNETIANTPANPAK